MVCGVGGWVSYVYPHTPVTRTGYAPATETPFPPHSDLSRFPTGLCSVQTYAARTTSLGGHSFATPTDRETTGKRTTPNVGLVRPRVSRDTNVRASLIENNYEILESRRRGKRARWFAIRR